MFPCSFSLSLSLSQRCIFLTRFFSNLSYPAFLSPCLRSKHIPPRKFISSIHRELILDRTHWCFFSLISCIKRDMNSIIFAILLSFRTISANYITSHFIRIWFVTNKQFPFCFFLREAASTIKTTKKQRRTIPPFTYLCITVSFFLRWIHPKRRKFLLYYRHWWLILLLFFSLSRYYYYHLLYTNTIIYMYNAAGTIIVSCGLHCDDGDD